MKFQTTILLAVLAAAFTADTAQAELRFCNRTGGSVDVAFAYAAKDAPGTTTNQHGGVVAKGWYTLSPGQCSQVSDIHVGNHWVYYYADGHGGTWRGSSMLCIPSSAFSKGVRFIHEGEACSVGNRLRGFQRISASTRGYTMNLNP